MHKMGLAAIIAAGVIGLATFSGNGKAFADEGHEHHEVASEAAKKGEPCPVSGDKIEQEGKYTYEYKGKVYNFCCADCLNKFKKEPGKYMEKAKAGSAASAGLVGTEGAADTHYGLFGLLDRRSRYGQYWFPEPFRLDETDVDNEIRFDWVHLAKKGHVNDQVSAELEKSFGLTTVELEIPYERDTLTTTDTGTGLTSKERTHGVGNIELSVRRPFHQFVSKDGFFDNTVGLGVEVGLPTDSPISHNTEAVVKMFDSLRLGEHFSLQSIAGYSVLMGPGEEGGNQTLEYGAVLGYNLTGSALGLPFVEQVIPILEVKGERGLKGSEAGKDNISGTVGVRTNLGGIGPLQPRLGIGYVFPIDSGAREDFKWGVVTSLVFEY
jgi:YHS domain-containing protein